MLKFKLRCSLMLVCFIHTVVGITLTNMDFWLSSMGPDETTPVTASQVCGSSTYYFDAYYPLQPVFKAGPVDIYSTEIWRSSTPLFSTSTQYSTVSGLLYDLVIALSKVAPIS